MTAKITSTTGAVWNRPSDEPGSSFDPPIPAPPHKVPSDVAESIQGTGVRQSSHRLTDWTWPSNTQKLGPDNERLIVSARIAGMQKWEGRVLEVLEGVITAELSPLDHEGGTLLADFDADLLTPDDEVVQAGDIVYLTVRTVSERGAYKTKTSALRLRRIGKWSEEELTVARNRARQRLESFQNYVD